MNHAPSILLIDASELIGNLIERTFVEQESRLIWVHNLAEAFATLATQAVQVIIYDLADAIEAHAQDLEMLSGKRGNIPLLVIAASGGSSARVRMLELGADDCLLRPFEVSELRARVAVLQRRSSTTRPLHAGTHIRLGLRVIDCQNGRVDSPRGTFELETPELVVLNQLLAAQGMAVAREELCRAAFGQADAALLRRLNLLVRTLRHKLERNPHTPQFLLTARGQGLRLVGALIEDVPQT